MAVAIAKTVVPCHTCNVHIRMSRTVQTVQHSRGHRRAKCGPKAKSTYCDRWQRPLPSTSGATAQTQILIRFSQNRRPVGAGTEGGGMARDRECLSTARYGSRHSENGRAMPYLQIKCPHFPNRADSATLSRSSSREVRSERQTYVLRPFAEADTAHEWDNSTEAGFDSSF